MVRVVYVPNVLTKEGRQENCFPFDREATIKNYVEASTFDFTDCYIVHNGKKIEDTNVHLKDGDEILIVVDVGIAMAALAGLFKIISVVMAVVSIGMAIYSAVTANKRKPSFGTVSDGGLDESSPTYGWDGVQTTQDVGIPIPIIYGEHKVGGNIINQYTRIEGDKSYLNILLGISEGEISSIGSIKLNDNPIANFTSVTTATRLGTNSQTVIPNFEDQHNLSSLSVSLLYNSPYVYTTTKTDVEAFELHLTMPNGLYGQEEDTGAIQSWSVTYKVEYKEHSAGVYTDLGETTIADKQRNAIRRVFRKDGLAKGQYDIRITRTSADSDFYHTGDLSLTQVDEIETGDLAYPNVALLAIEALASEQLSGSTPEISCIAKGRLVSVPDVKQDGDSVAWEDYYYDPANDVFRLFSDDSECTWDEETFVSAYSANPIWCIKDLLTNTRYGLGEYIDVANLDEDTLLEMAKYADEKVSDGDGGFEKRFRLDVVIDSSSKATDILSQLCATFRCWAFYTNGTIKLKIDKAETPVQMFGMGNIIDGSFSQQWKSLKEIPNVIEVQYIDKNEDYVQEIISVMDETALQNGEPLRKQDLKVFCTRISQAIREGKFVLLVSKYIKRQIQFSAGIEAITCQAGDVINISHDVPQWGYSGTVQTGCTTSKVKLDRSVTITAGKTYKIRVKFADDTQEERTVSDSAGTYTEVNVSSAFTQIPQDFDRYAFGEENKVVAPYRVISLTRQNDGNVQLQAIEYNEDIYDTDDITLPDNNYSDLSDDIPVVTDLDCVERNVVLMDGSVENVIDVYFNKPNDTAYKNKFKSAKIYLSDNAGASYSLVGQTEGTSFTVTGNIVKGSTYYVKVLTVCTNGIEDYLSHAPSDSVTIVGKETKPANVSNFTYSWGNLLDLSWGSNTEADLAGYEIRDEDSNWGTDDSHLIFRGLANKKTLEPSGRTVGTFYIKAFNTSGVYSDSAVSVTPTNTAPSAPTGLSADVFFNIARAYWNDVADADVQYYEVYKSESNAWAGEEVLAGKVSGRQIELLGKSPRSGQVVTATTNTIVDSSLIGLSNDYFNGDVLTITAGTGTGEDHTVSDFDGTTGTITISDTFVVTLDTTTKFIINDRYYVKVRAVDRYGVGSFTSALTVTHNSLDENAFGDNVVTARKIYVACLSALSANMGCLTAGVIQGGTIQTGSGGARTVFNGTELRSYDAGCNVMFEVKDGCVTARTMKLVDPSCDCCYSYLSAGQWYFHDELGNNTPYPKRIDSGEANTGTTVCLCGWKSQPKVIVGIKQLLSYNADYSVNCQLWCIYYDNLQWFCTSATCYGYSFDVHAKLIKAAGAYAECIDDVGVGVSIYTHGDACCSRIRSIFNAHCYNSACSTCYYYGTICYYIKYKCCCAGCAWTCCCYAYCQPHASTAEILACCYACQDISFGGAGCWEVQLGFICTTWAVSTVSGVECCCCCRSVNSGDTHTRIDRYNCTMPNPSSYVVCVSLAGSNPTNVYCVYACLCWCTVSMCSTSGTGSCYYNSVGTFGINTLEYSCTNESGQNNLTISPPSACHDYSACSACSFTCFCLYSYLYGTGGSWTYSNNCFCLQGGYLVQCYCYVPGASATCYLHLYGNLDYSACQTILDPSGVLNWLAIGYS